MVRTTSGILAEIVEQKHHEVAQLNQRAAALEREAHERKSAPRGFDAALRQRKPAIIAEVKKASPSKGLLKSDFHPALIAHAYEQAGAACISVLTDKAYFRGSLHDLEAARAAVNIPVLRKDFTIDRLQIFEAAAYGADAVLLIAAILDSKTLQQLRELASSLGMDALVEVHNEEELERAVDSGATIIGVNNRDLNTFEISLDTSIRLSFLMPASAIRVSESGIHNHGDVRILLEAGYDAFLIGESLMRASDPAKLLSELSHGV